MPDVEIGTEELDEPVSMTNYAEGGDTDAQASATTIQKTMTILTTGP